MKKNKEKKIKNKNKSLKNAPHTAQETIPYIGVYKNGIIETEPGIFTKSYKFEDVNFKTASEDVQEKIFLKFGELLNTLGIEADIEVTIHNKSISNSTTEYSVIIDHKNDSLDHFRDEYNKMLRSKLSEGMNNIQRDKYITLSIECDTIDQATSTFIRIDDEVLKRLKSINGMDTRSMSTLERLSLLHDIYNIGFEDEVIETNRIGSETILATNLEDYAKGKNSTKDLVCPSGFVINDKYIQIGDLYAKTLFLKTLPSYLKTDMLSDITDLPCNMLTSVYYTALPQDQGIKIIRNQMVNINSNVVDAQKKASKAGYSADLISPELLGAQREAKELLDDMTGRDQKLFYTTFIVTVFAPSLEKLNKYGSMVQSVGNKYLCQFRDLLMQQEQGLNSALPLCLNQLYVRRLLTTESASVFMPFSAQELSQKSGMYYGLNAVSRNLIMYNRSSGNNANGLILGKPGSGKSFTAKREMVNVALTTNDQIYIIDPEGEYSPLVNLLGGKVIRIAAGSSTYLNPFDMDLKYADDDDPITLKSDYIVSLCETIAGGRYGLDPIQISIIDRCVRELYKDYLTYMHTQKPNLSCYKPKSPTLKMFYDMLLTQPEQEAKYLATSIEIYAKGSMDTFSHTTNVETDSRIICYNIKDIGSSMKEMGLQVCLNEIWNKAILNKSKGIRTWFYMDEFHLLLANENSAKFLKEIYKRARKWMAIPTGITQNVDDLLSTTVSKAIIDNCEFILMLDQSPNDRDELAMHLNISENQLGYISTGSHGQGLIYTGKTIVPFVDEFPRDTDLYKAMTTKPEETNKYDKKMKAEQMKKMPNKIFSRIE